MFGPPSLFSEKRRELCSRENAQRVAARVFDTRNAPVSIVRTNDPLQPFRVSKSPTSGETVEMVMVS